MIVLVERGVRGGLAIGLAALVLAISGPEVIGVAVWNFLFVVGWSLNLKLLFLLL